MAMDQTLAVMVQDALHGVAPLPTLTGHKMLLMTAMGTPTVNGTELASGGSYVAGTGQAVAFSAATAATPSISVTNPTTTNFTNMPTQLGIDGVELHVTTYGRVEYGAFTGGAIDTVAGDTLSVTSYASGLQ